MRQLIQPNGAELDTHIAMLQRMVNKGLADGESRKLAVKIVSGKFDTARDPRGQIHSVVTAYGGAFTAPPGPTCRMQDDRCEIEKIWDFMALNVRYVYDTTTMDVFCTLRETLIAGGADCDDQTIAFATLLGSIGFTVIARVITLKSAPDDWAHVYPLVGLSKGVDKKWMALDQSVKGTMPGWEYPNRAKHKDYVLVSSTSG